MILSRAPRRLVWAGLLVLLSASAHAEPGLGVSQPASPASADGGGAPPTEPWWSALGGPELRALIDEALPANLDLAQAVDRIRLADAQRMTAITTLLPNLSFDTNVSSTPASLRFAQFSGGAADDLTGLYFFGSSVLNANVELDITGRNVLGVQAATLDREASARDAAAAAVAIASRIAGAWFDHAQAESRLALLERLEGTARDVLATVELRFARAEATAVDVLQQKQQVASIQAQIPLVRAARAVARNQLLLLLGRPAGSDLPALPAALPDAGPTPPLPSPGDLEEAQPAIDAAELRLKSAWQRRMAAERSLLPTLRATFNAGWSYTNNAGGNLFGGATPGFQDWFTWGFGGSLTVPLFNGGRSIAQIQSARASERLAAHALSGAKLSAWTALDNARVADTEQAQRLDLLRAQVDAARTAFELARERYSRGIGDFLSLLTTQSAWQNAELGLLAARRDAIAARIQLHDAIGGAWTRHLLDPKE